MIWFSILAGAAFVWLFLRRGRWVALLAGFSWLAYGVYEYGIKVRILCSGDCNIRVDLVFIYPYLLVLSGWALVQQALSLRRHEDNR